MPRSAEGPRVPAVVAAAALAAWGAPTGAAAEDARLRADLEAVSRRTVFFGHQSVGANVLDGLQALSREGGVALRVQEVGSASGLPAGTLAHAFVPENGDPLRKLQSFERALGAGGAGSPEVALVKFCYVDVTPGTDVKALFAAYREAMGRLRAAHPSTTFVHVTVPLTGVQGGIKGAVKRLLGRAPYGIEENLRREEYNAMLRGAYQGKEPVFDLARVESTGPGGRVETADWKGQRVPVLVSAYTTDGGHLDAEGQRLAARELLAVLAAVPPRPAGVAAAPR